MADQHDIDFTYTTIDQIFRLSIGDTGDFSGAMYDGNFGMRLEEAQRRKHQFIVNNLHIGEGSKVLDMGCGWGPFIRYATEKVKAECIGLTLSEAQVRACRKRGYNVHLMDCRKISPEDFGKFDAIVSLGAFEHFCSVEEYKSGKQKEVYSDFFRSVADLLPKGKRFYLQTMTFGENMIPHQEIDIRSDKGSDAYILALMVKEFPGSWLPYGSEMVLECAAPFFIAKSISSGRLDYIETIAQWRKRFRRFNLKKYLLYLSLIPQYFTNQQFKYRLEVFKVSPNKVCFERKLLDHYRFVFEKR